MDEGREWDEKTPLEFKGLVNSKILAHYETRRDHPIFKGHFPDHPILPGVVQIEMMAQAGAFTLVPALMSDMDKSNIEVAFLSVTSAKFRAPIYPDMKLDIEAVCTRLRSPMISHQSKIFCAGELMSEASTLCSVKANQ